MKPHKVYGYPFVWIDELKCSQIRIVEICLLIYFIFLRSTLTVCYQVSSTGLIHYSQWAARLCQPSLLKEIRKKLVPLIKLYHLQLTTGFAFGSAPEALPFNEKGEKKCLFRAWRGNKWVSGLSTNLQFHITIVKRCLLERRVASRIKKRKKKKKDFLTSLRNSNTPSELDGDLQWRSLPPIDLALCFRDARSPNRPPHPKKNILQQNVQRYSLN